MAKLGIMHARCTLLYRRNTLPSPFFELEFDQLIVKKAAFNPPYSTQNQGNTYWSRQPFRPPSQTC
ncbi:hypothetical protein Echvi_3339 [Echinicola vietnamensis DSM 17526]|uniref:Uncharacterized protein n=1 Tax=Echinicola vietnamensis (strain DSM 17526 / LMG 23754 / KMM 6221) TaxID=926556 RepID=L0G217_ECHVK|nr:hypothetical protein Echvi_3339 [Echinicola vietnamensis DSM 17526]